MQFKNPGMNKFLIYFSSAIAVLGHTFSMFISRLGMYSWLSSIFFIIFIVYFLFVNRKADSAKNISENKKSTEKIFPVSALNIPVVAAIKES